MEERKCNSDFRENVVLRFGVIEVRMKEKNFFVFFKVLGKEYEEFNVFELRVILKYVNLFIVYYFLFNIFGFL